MRSLLLPAALCVTCALGQTNEIVRRAVISVSTGRIQSNIEKLITFGERTPQANVSNKVPEWIMGEFRSYSPQLKVDISEWASDRNLPPIHNVVAILPGTATPGKQILLTAHYDSRVGVGASDNAAGTAAMMETARILSQRTWPMTLVFIAFDAEEVGLLGSKVEASEAKREGRQIEAVINADVVGNGPKDKDVEGPRLLVFGGTNALLPPARLATFIQRTGERYTDMQIEVVYKQDGPTHASDHMPYQDAGFAAIRLLTPHETRTDHHSLKDTIDKVSFTYTALVAKVMVSAAASLALGLN